MRIGAAQLRPVAGDIAANIARHLALIELAVDLGAELVYFPELSLTGYEPRLARALATDTVDPRLDALQQHSDAHTIIVGVGLPLATGSQPRIGMLWLAPHGPRRGYAKQHLHSDELPFFIPGEGQLVLAVAGHTLVPAICYESLNPRHAAAAAQLGADVYLASVAKPPGPFARAMEHYPGLARTHGMYVTMANAVGPCDDFVSVGQSAAWGRSGELLAQMDRESDGLVLLDTARGTARIQLLAQR